MTLPLLPQGVVPDELPAYVYNLSVLRANVENLKSELPSPSALLYSLKANPHPSVVSTLVAVGCRVEICSSGELEVVRNLAIDPLSVIYTGPAHTDGEVEAALDAGVRIFCADSRSALQQLERYAAAADVRVQVLLRINDGAVVGRPGLTMTGAPSQFGVDLSWIESRPKEFRSGPHSEIVGFQLYTGSNMQSRDDLLAQFSRSIEISVQLASTLGIKLTIVDLGGGFGAPFARAGVLVDLTGLGAEIETLLDRSLPRWRTKEPLIAFESGRFLAATAGALYTRVLDVKESQGRTVAILQSGVNHLGGMSGLRRLPVVAPTVHTSISEVSAPSEVQDPGVLLTGPLCTPLDVLSRSAHLPDVASGDVVIIPNVGAYGLRASLMGFLGHPCPAEYIYDGDEFVNASRLSIYRRELHLESESSYESERCER